MKNQNLHKRGAPLGNQNARTHGFYAKKLSKREQAALEDASAVKGVDNEIALLRVKIASVIDSAPENVRVLTAAISTLAKLLKLKVTLVKNDPDSIEEAVRNMWKQEVAPLGFWPVYNQEGEIVMTRVDQPLPQGGLPVAPASPESKQTAREYMESLKSRPQADDIK